MDVSYSRPFGKTEHTLQLAHVGITADWNPALPGWVEEDVEDVDEEDDDDDAPKPATADEVP